MRKRKIKFLFGGYSGENNTGAESRLVTIIQDIKETFQNDYDLRLTMGTLSLKNTSKSEALGSGLHRVTENVIARK